MTTTPPARARATSLLDPLARLGTTVIAFVARAERPKAGQKPGAGGTYGGETGGYGGGQGYPSRPGGYGPPQQEPPPTPGEMACCSLAFPEGPYCEYTGRRQDYVCPEGWYRQWWHCCEGSRLAGCGECTRSQSTCWSGPFLCSMWWETDQSC